MLEADFILKNTLSTNKQVLSMKRHKNTETFILKRLESS